MILTRTPLRVSLFGGGTDYPDWFSENGGAILGMAIDKYVYVGLKHMPPGQVGDQGTKINYRVQYSHVDDCVRIADIQHPAVKGALQYLCWDGEKLPLEFHIFGDLPGRSGLGGSSSCMVGVITTLDVFITEYLYKNSTDSMIPRHVVLNSLEDIANLAIHIERNVIKETVGCQDQILAALGGLRSITFPTDGRWTATNVSLPQERIQALEDSLVLVYTGIMRNSSEMAARQIHEQGRNHGSVSHGVFCTPRFALHLMAQQAEAGRKVLTSKGEGLDELGPLLHDAWQLKRGITDGLTRPEVDVLYEHGLACGATGGKLLGAGGGGYMLFYIPQKNRRRFEQTFGAPTTTFKISERGTHVLVCND